MLVSGVIGLIGLALTLVGGLVGDSKTALYSYLVAFAYWCGISVASLILLQAFHASAARWTTLLKRGIETMAATAPLFLVLFIPIVLGMKKIFPWMDPGKLPKRELALLHGKSLYLSQGSFLLRAALYFITWILVTQVLYGWSTRQDENGDPLLTIRQRRFATGFIPWVALTITFAGFDWLMSLNPFWFSTMWGAYYFAGSFLGAICIWTIATVTATDTNAYGAHVTPHHLHNLGKLMLAFTAFWAYIGFSQFLLIWIANIPEETVFYAARITGSWKPVSQLLVVGHFIVPFFILLSQRLKLFRRPLLLMALWLLLMHWVDMYWVIMPALNPSTAFTWTTTLTTISAFAGVGGLAIAFALFRARGRFSLPVKDPFLADSLRYTQP